MAIMRLPRLRVRTYLLLVGVVALLVWGTRTGILWYVYYQRVRIYSFQERILRENAQRDLAQGNTRTVDAMYGLQTADYYARLVRKYRRAMWRPWICVEFEPPYFYPGGELTTLQKQLEARFGPLSPHAQHRLEYLSPERVEALAHELLTAQSLRELGLED
jgi:hypothetical protein